MEKVEINKLFLCFLEKHEKIIIMLFHKLKLFKTDIPNAYLYSDLNPPKRRNYKYTDKLFLGCILYIVLNNRSWNSTKKNIAERYFFLFYCKIETSHRDVSILEFVHRPYLW